MPPQSGTRKPLTASYTWGQPGLEAQFGAVFQPGQGIFSPGYPLEPSEPERVRLWDFPVGVNTIYTPRAYEPIAFDELRALADAHDITRLAIETRKDQIEKLDWAIKPRSIRVPAADAVTRSAQLADFWRQPDGERPFASWLRELLEDVLVLDAPALELRRNRGGEIIGLDVVDGATIKVLFDETGRRPKPPAPAFEQVIHGRPWKLLTSERRTGGTSNRSGSSRSGSTAYSPAIPARARGSYGARAARSTSPSRRRPTRTSSTSGWRASSATPSRCRPARSPARSIAPPRRRRRRPRSPRGWRR